MGSDFRKKKLLYVYSFFDSDKSGTVDKKDFEVSAETIAKKQGWSAGDEKYQKVQETLLKIWTALQKSADSDNDGHVSLDEWISTCDEYVKNPTDENHWLALYSKFIFQLEDASNDGAIDSDEFSKVYVAFGSDKAEAVEAFKKMANGKDTVSWAEFQKLWKEYFASEDPAAPGNFIFSKLSF